MNVKPVIQTIERTRRDILTLQSSFNTRVVAISNGLPYEDDPDVAKLMRDRAYALQNDAANCSKALAALRDAQAILESLRD